MLIALHSQSIRHKIHRKVHNYFWRNSRLNKNGGTLIFTTHYPELLDEYDRKDGICIVRNRNGITAENLNYILKRNDIKKSDA